MSNPGASDQADLDRRELLNRLRACVEDERPRNVLLAGPWGSGKSRLLEDLAQALEKATDGQHYHVIRFSPNELSSDADPRIALLRRLEAETRASSLSDQIKNNIRKSGPELLRKGLTSGAKLGAKTLISPFDMGTDIAKGLSDNIGDSFDVLMRAILKISEKKYPDVRMEEHQALRMLIKGALINIQKQKGNRRIALLVDDLDRTRPEQAVAFLESVYRLVLPNEEDSDSVSQDWPLTSVWAVNVGVLGEYLYREYREVPSFEPVAYMEKLFHVRVSVPPLLAPQEGHPPGHAKTSAHLWAQCLGQGYGPQDALPPLAIELARKVNYACLGNLRVHRRLRETFRDRLKDKGYVADEAGALNVAQASPADLVRTARLLFVITAFGSFRDHIALYDGMWPHFVNRLNRRHRDNSLEMVANPVYRHLDNADLVTVLMDLGVLEYDNAHSCYRQNEGGLIRFKRELIELSQAGY